MSRILGDPSLRNGYCKLVEVGRGGATTHGVHVVHAAKEWWLHDGCGASFAAANDNPKKKKARSELAMSRSNEFVNCDCLPFASVPGPPYRRLYVWLTLISEW